MTNKKCFLLYSRRNYSFISDVVIPAVKAAGYAPRHDENIFKPGQDWQNVIISEIKEADLVIADLTSYSSTIAYDLGLTRAWGKNVIPIASSSNGLPFDQSRYYTLIYENNYHEYFAQQLVATIAQLEISIINESIIEYAGRKEIIGVRVHTETSNPSEAYRFTADLIDYIEEITESKLIEYIGSQKGSVKSFFSLDFNSIVKLIEKILFFKHEWDKRNLQNDKLRIEIEQAREKLDSEKRKRLLDEYERFMKLHQKYKDSGLKEIQIGEYIIKLDCNEFSLLSSNK